MKCPIKATFAKKIIFVVVTVISKNAWVSSTTDMMLLEDPTFTINSETMIIHIPCYVCSRRNFHKLVQN